MESYSTFYDNNKRHETKLRAELIKREVTDVFVCGLAADVCVGKKVIFYPHIFSISIRSFKTINLVNKHSRISILLTTKVYKIEIDNNKIKICYLQLVNKGTP